MLGTGVATLTRSPAPKVANVTTYDLSSALPAGVTLQRASTGWYLSDNTGFAQRRRRQRAALQLRSSQRL